MHRPKQPGMATAEETLAGMASPEALESVSSCPADSPEWLPELLRRHLRRVLSVLYRILGNTADSQDLAQEVFLKAFLRRHQLRDPERALAWLLRIASNAAIDFQRSSAADRRVEQWVEQDWPHPAVDSMGLSPEQQVLRGERERRLHRALQMLSPKERAAIVLRDLEGLSGAEVARHLGCSQITVRTHIASARIKLRRYLGKTT